MQGTVTTPDDLLVLLQRFRSLTIFQIVRVLGKQHSINNIRSKMKRLVELYTKALEQYAKNPKAAQSLATEPIGPLPAGMQAPEMAAWTVVGNVLLNLDEVFAKR